MKERRRRRIHRVTVLAAGAFLFVALHVDAQSFRDILGVTADTYFDGSYSVVTDDVFLARFTPSFSGLAEVIRTDHPGWYQHVVFLGPVVNLSPTVYASLKYGLGFDSNAQLMHEGDLELTHERPADSESLAVRYVLFPSMGYSYALPSVSLLFRPIDPLSVFGKFFMSFDSNGSITESFWGEAGYSLTPAVVLRGGFTFGYAAGFGYSLIGGVNWNVTPRISLKYSFQWLANSLVLTPTPAAEYGIENDLVADFRF